MPALLDLSVPLCARSRAVHIQCMPDLPTGIQLRLVGGKPWNGRYASGRVDVFKDNQWGTASTLLPRVSGTTCT